MPSHQFHLGLTNLIGASCESSTDSMIKQLIYVHIITCTHALCYIYVGEPMGIFWDGNGKDSLRDIYHLFISHTSHRVDAGTSSLTARAIIQLYMGFLKQCRHHSLDTPSTELHIDVFNYYREAKRAERCQRIAFTMRILMNVRFVIHACSDPVSRNFKLPDNRIK